MHAYASLDPIFLAMNERGQQETGGELGGFCVGCHAPMAVKEGATTDGRNMAEVPNALQGITCYFCHQVVDVAGTHNNPLVLANDTTMRGGIENPVKYGAHRSKYSTLHDSDGLESSKLCGACHDIVVPAHFSGAAADVHLERTFEEWTGSYLNDPENLVQAQSCGRCHFQKEYNQPIASPANPTKTMPVRPARHVHEFPAIDTALVDGFPEMARQREAIEAFLDLSLRVQTCVDPLTSAVRVTLENNSAGHNFPSGATQDRRVWTELHAYDAADPAREVCSSGVVPPGESVTGYELNPASPNGTLGAQVLYDVTTKLDGSPAHMFWDVANVEHRSIPVAPIGDPTGRHAVIQNYDMSVCTGQLAALSRVTVTVWVEAVGLDVLDDMAAHGYPLTDVRARMPRIAVLPKRHSTIAPNPTVTLEWTPATSSGQDQCVETTAGSQSL